MYDKVHTDVEDEDYYSRISDDVNRTFRQTGEEQRENWTAEDYRDHYQKVFEEDCRLRGIPYPPEGLGEYEISSDSDDEYNLKGEFMKRGIDLTKVDENTKDFRIQMKMEYPGGDIKVRHWVLDDRTLASEGADPYPDDFYARVTRPILENPPLNCDLKCMAEGIYKGNEHYFRDERFSDHPYLDENDL